MSWNGTIITAGITASSTTGEISSITGEITTTTWSTTGCYGCGCHVTCVSCYAANCNWCSSSGLCGEFSCGGTNDCGSSSSSSSQDSESAMYSWLTAVLVMLLFFSLLGYCCRRCSGRPRPTTTTAVQHSSSVSARDRRRHAAAASPGLQASPYAYYNVNSDPTDPNSNNNGYFSGGGGNVVPIDKPINSIVIHNLDSPESNRIDVVTEDPSKPNASETTQLLPKSEGAARSDVLICNICMENERNVALGCGHMMCERCMRQVTLCPFCKKQITYAQKIFLN